MQTAGLASLSGAVALVTGGSRGIGFAIADRLGQLGLNVILTARDAEQAAKAAQELAASGHSCSAIACDVRDLSSVENLIGQLRRRHGRIDVLVNNAGVGGPAVPLRELPPDDWDNIFETNLRGVYYVTRAAIPLMISSGGGHIINISSLAGKNPLPNGAAYAASKWGLNGLTYSLAEELRNDNIRVSLVCPGSVNTGFSQRGQKDAAKKLQPDDVAHAVAMLVTQQPQSFISDISIRPTRKT
jgi:NAD(P)-dependent dehydrogenase (short-subunit alcohol dehydrogenase family)